ncbi:MAG: 50S ribosomal protein L18 [Actinomycetota bacterium]
MKNTSKARQIRHRRVRKRISGSAERPRLAVFRSNRHLYAQLINDLDGRTIVSASTMDPALKSNDKNATSDAAVKVGKLVAERALEKGVKTVVFDRGGFRFHGRIKALADAAREQGLSF